MANVNNDFEDYWLSQIFFLFLWVDANSRDFFPLMVHFCQLMKKSFYFFVEFAKVKLQLKGPGNKAQDLTDANKIEDSEHIPLEVPNVKFDLDGCV